MKINDLMSVLTLKYGNCYINDRLDEMSEENKHDEIIYMKVEDNGVVYIDTIIKGGK